MILSLCFYMFASLIGVVLLYIKWKQTYWKRKGVDYIKPDFLYGNTTAITKQQQHQSFLFEGIYKQFKSRGKRFGGIYDFFTPMLFVTDLELIKCILQKDFSHFVNRIGYINEENDPFTGGVFNLKDQKWRNMRAKLTPTFTAGKMRMMFDTMVKHTEGLEKLLDPYASLNDPVDIRNILLLFTTDIIASVAFGLDINTMENPNTEFRKYFDKLLEPSFTEIAKRIISSTFPHWLLDKIKFRISRKEIRNFFIKLVKDIVEHREKNNVYRKDLIHLMIQIRNMGQTTDNEKFSNENGIKHLSINEMAAQSLTLYVAGFETSSSAMMLALMHLAMNMDIQDRLRREMQTVLEKHNNKLTYDSIMEMEYLEMVLQETLRLSSVAGDISRQCTKAYPIPESDVVIEKGIEVLISIYGLHRDPEYFPNPEKFDPERFNQENKKKILPCTYMPFGEGPRQCIGLRFGKLQSKIGLCAILLKYKVTLSSKTKHPIKYSSNLLPTIVGGLWINLEKLLN